MLMEVHSIVFRFHGIRATLEGKELEMPPDVLAELEEVREDQVKKGAQGRDEGEDEGIGGHEVETLT